MPGDWSAADGHYIAGLVDGEGYFTVSLKVDTRNRRGGLTIGTTFGIALRIDDSALLRWVHEILGCGHVRMADSGQRRCPMVRYTVADRGSLHNIIVPFFDRFPLRSKKRRDFDLWKEAVALAYTVFGERRRWVDGIWVPKWTPERLARLQEVRDAIIAVRRLKEATR